jgi:hypothetical protein
MNPDVQRDIMRRLTELERTTVRYRAGEITDTDPLDVALGGSDVPYEDVRAVESGVTTGDQVATLVFGNDLLVLGKVTDAPLRIVRGIVNTTTPTIVAGAGFSVAKNGTGDVTITFDDAFSAAPSVNATPVGVNEARAQNRNTPTTADCRIVGRNSAGTIAETEFSFTAIGPA